MSKVIAIKLTKVGLHSGPFDIFDQDGNVIAEDVPKEDLITGKSYRVEDSVYLLNMKSTGECKSSVGKSLKDMSIYDYHHIELDRSKTSCMWDHLVDKTIYNSYYGDTNPYIIEYPFSYQYKDQILQAVEVKSKVYTYFNPVLGSSDKNNRVELDDAWFNKAILYSGYQTSGLLELSPKPKGNMREYMLYPKFNKESKGILWTKSDNLYQYNTFWNVLKDRSVPMFLSSCKSLSTDKILNQTNMDYSPRAFRKDTIRGKDLKIRHILDNRSDLSIVSQFILTPTQISYK